MPLNCHLELKGDLVYYRKKTYADIQGFFLNGLCAFDFP